MPTLVSSFSFACLGLAAYPADEPTFTRDVAPIVFEHCAVCHRPGQSAPFSLLSYDDVEPRAEQIVQVTQSRYMPPWLPVEGHGDFAGDRRLEDTQIDLLRRWVEAGVPEGVPDQLPATPVFTEGWQLGDPDLVVEMEEVYTVPAGGRDLFRSFVLPLPVEENRYVRAVELSPGNFRVVHHAVMMIDESGASRELDAADDEPGFGGMDATTAHAPDGHFLGWTPGKFPSLLPAELAWTLRPGTDLVLQLHLVPTGKAEPVRSRVGLFFSDLPPTRTPFLMRLGSRTLDIPAEESAYTIEDEFTVPVSVAAIGVYPHAHYLGKQMEIEAQLPDGSKQWLLRIADWDFNWQDDYRYARPVALPAGTRLRGRIVYDNSADNVRNPNAPPRRVAYGPESFDEMGDLWLQVVPELELERDELARSYHQKDVRLRLDGYRFAITEEPEVPNHHYNLGLCLGQLGDIEGARACFERAVEIDAKFVNALGNLGILLAEQGELEEARARFQQAVDADPEHASATVHANLGALCLRAEQFAKAREHTLAAIEANPKHLKAHLNLVTIYRHFDDSEGQLRHLAEAARLQPADLDLQLQWVNALLDAGRSEEALRQLDALANAGTDSPALMTARGRALEGVGRLAEAAELYESRLARDANAQMALRFAWILSTAADDSLRDGKKALFWARGSTERLAEDPYALDVLAAAFAEAGRFKKALNTARKAFSLARAAGDAERSAAIQERIAAYQEDRPWRDG